MKSHHNVLVIDTETTGLDPELGAEIVECAFRLGLRDGSETKLWRVKPMRPIPPEAIAIHGITNEMTEKWPSFGEIADEVAKWVRWSSCIIGYNPDYDIKMIDVELIRAGIHVKWPKVILCAKRLWDIHRPRPPRDLQAAYQQFVDPSGFEGAHGALKDARATAQVFNAQLEAFGLKQAFFEDLDPERMSWWGLSNHVVWKDHVLICNFGKNAGTPFHELEYGMLRWIMGKDFPRHVKGLAQQAMIPRKQETPRETAVRLARWAREQFKGEISEES